MTPDPLPTVPNVTVYFAYSSHLPNQAGTWGAAFFLPHHNDDDAHIFGGFLSPLTTSEDGALDEVLRLLHLLDIHHAHLYTEHPILISRRTPDLPQGLTLALSPRNHVRQRVAQRETYRLCHPFTELHTQGRHQRVLRENPTSDALLTCRFRCERQTLFLDLCAHGLQNTLQLGRLTAQGHLLLNSALLKPRLHQHLLRLYGPALAPEVVRLGDLLLTDLEHRLLELHQHGRTLWTTPAGVDRLLRRTGVMPDHPHLYCTRVSDQQVRLHYRGRHIIRNVKRPQDEWSQIVRQLMQSVGASETDLLQHATYTRQVHELPPAVPPPPRDGPPMTLPGTPSPPLAWHVALTAPARPGIDAWDNRVTVLLDGQILTVTQGDGRNITPVTLAPSFLALTRELLDQPHGPTHRVLILDEHADTGQHCARVVYDARLPLTSPRAELSLLRPCARQALSAGADGRWWPVQAASLLNPPGSQPQLHIHHEVVDAWE